MLKYLLVMLLCLGGVDVDAADAFPSVTVFEAGKEGYPHYRIPGIVAAANGDLLVFAEGRMRTDDHARNDIVLKRSLDAGATWLPIQVIHKDPELVMVNPSAVVLKNGRVLLFYETFPHGLHTRKGHDYAMMDTGFAEGRTQRLLMRTSDDNGKTWSAATDLTKRSRLEPNDINSGSPASAIQLQKGKHAGRIILPMFITVRLSASKRTWRNAVLYSDDQGKSWTRGALVPLGGTDPCNECLVAELDDGRVMMNGRSRKKMRSSAVSTDGGASWQPWKYEKGLPGRACHSGFLRYSYAGNDKPRLLFTNNNSLTRRANGTIRISYDDGATWSVSKVLVPGLFGYSQLCRMKDDRVGMIYEPFESPKQKWSILFMPIDLQKIEQ